PSYLEDPAAAFAELARVLVPGGLLLASAESPVGAVLGDDKLSLDHLPEVLARSELRIEGFERTRYRSAAELSALVEAAGLRVLRAGQSHHIAEGPLRRWADGAGLEDKSVRARLLAAERALRADPRFEPLGRVSYVVARKGGEART
ncbi:MAG: class I SAM-dependent methyltransferase, partial [Candidatus Methylomirabilis sp.]|nr:class I SAM-dependent methyltransferase [Deltaproteobacteria bacterium]